MVLAIEWKGDSLLLLDQRVLPEKVEYVKCSSLEDVSAAIRDMVVRGAPAIGIAAAYGIALGVAKLATTEIPGLDEQCMAEAAQLLVSTRPTAVNLRWAVDRVLKTIAPMFGRESVEAVFEAALLEAQLIEQEDIAINRAIGAHGAELIKPRTRILTHCNAGALATGGYGTALGVVRKAWQEGKLDKVYADETRPFLQGSRLTAWELLQDGIDVTVLADSAAGYLMSLGQVDFIVVGADRIARNGDVANKIGTYTLACLAQKHDIPFYVAAPFSTFDLAIPGGSSIPVELRHESEVLCFMGRTLAPKGAKGFNPAFDITPASLIHGIITERGVVSKPTEAGIHKLMGCLPHG